MDTIAKTIDDELNAMCSGVAHDLLASVDSTDQKIIDAKLRTFVEQVATEALENQSRAGTPGEHCFYCGTRVLRTVRCECGFGESFGCAVANRSICEACSKAHKTVARHLGKTFALPVVWRSNSRRRRLELMLVDAAFAVCNPNESDKYNPNKSQDLAYWLLQADSIDQIPDNVLRQKTLDAFRKSKFLEYKELAVALEREKDREILRGLTRTIAHQLGRQ